MRDDDYLCWFSAFRGAHRRELRSLSRFEFERALLWACQGKPDGLGGLIRPGDPLWEPSGGFTLDPDFYAAIQTVRASAPGRQVRMVVRTRPDPHEHLPARGGRVIRTAWIRLRARARTRRASDHALAKSPAKASRIRGEAS
jgi:hypothetical protein